MTVEEMANMINEECKDFNWLAVNRLLRETEALWTKAKHREYLHKDALTLLNNDPKIDIRATK